MKALTLAVIILGITFFGAVIASAVHNLDLERYEYEVKIIEPVEDNGGLAVNVQDQTTRLFQIPINRVLDDNSYGLAVTPVVGQYDITLNSTVGLIVGDKISFLEQNGEPQIYFGNIMVISGNVITLNDPVPFAYNPSKVQVFTFDNQLSVDGSGDPVVFSIDNYFPTSVDITRIIFKCTDDTEMHDGLFCGETELNRGILFRKKLLDGHYINYFNVKNNAKWSLIAYDISYTDKGKPPDDTYGFGTRLTFGGQSKHGVVIRLEQGESIELLVQDDLTGVSFISLVVEGHFTDE